MTEFFGTTYPLNFVSKMNAHLSHPSPSPGAVQSNFMDIEILFSYNFYASYTILLIFSNH